MKKDKTLKYQDALDYLERVSKMEVPHFSEPRIGLKRMQELLKLLGNPGKNLRGINVVGTSGKGSVTKMMASCLEKAGYKVGATYSPEIYTVRERMELNNKIIPERTFAKLLEKIKPVLEKMVLKSRYGMPSYYEITTALALLYFKQAKTDYIVLEACMGGKFDCTNVLSKQELLIVCSIGIDHTQFLGKNLQAIAAEKMGILKKGTVVISAKQDLKVEKVIKEKIRQEKASLKLVKSSVQKLKIDWKGSSFAFEDETYNLAMIGSHQAQNASMVIKSLVALGLNKKVVQQGLKRVTLKARFEIVSNAPKIILDGAHNPQKMAALVKTLKQLSKKKVYFVFGMMADKDVEKSLEQVLPIAKKIYFTLPKTDGRKTASFSRYARISEKFGVKCSLCVNPNKALLELKKQVKKDDLICVTGSFALLAEMRITTEQRIKRTRNQTSN